MAYDHQRQDKMILVPTSLADAANIAASRYYVGSQPEEIQQLWATIVANVATATCTATFKYRPTPGSDTGASTVGTLVMPVATGLAGRSFYKSINGFKALPGSELILSFTGGSGAGGQAAFGVGVAASWDNPGNIAAMILSA